ncbi:MAG: FKBP-type peptidyl-prolyl cis-trans isomerase [Bacteroidia bacterium]|jgi:FKBP-type peptidyl-prolyl cis-trans isomerase
MKKNILILSALSFGMLACNNGFETTESGNQYRILAHEEGTREVKPGEMILLNLRLSTESTDSVIMETFKDNTPRYIPADEPVLREVLAMLTKGDSAEFLINADSLFLKSFGMEKPESMKDEKNVRFIVKVVDVFDQDQLKSKSMEQVKQLSDKDSIDLQTYVATLSNVNKTASGLMYVVDKEGSGKSPLKGDKVSMRYKGYFLNGETFDENLEREPLEFTLGLGQVIPGWDEGVALMKTGSKYKFIIPWQLAYGERGSGPILPCSSLIFEVELLKITQQ